MNSMVIVSIGRMAEEWETPINRCRLVNDGDTVDVRDRTLVATRPPLYDVLGPIGEHLGAVVSGQRDHPLDVELG